MIGVLRHLTSGGRANTSHKVAVREVAKLVWCNGTTTVFCLDMRLIKRKLEDLWSIYRKAKDPFQRGRLTSTAMVNYTDKLASQCDKLFDVAASTEQQLATCKEHCCVDMSPHEWQYLEDQRTNRNMVCSHGVDMVWFVVKMQRQRKLEKLEAHRKAMKEQFENKSLKRLGGLLRLGPWP